MMREALERLVSEFDQYHDGASNDHHLRLAVESAREALASVGEGDGVFLMSLADGLHAHRHGVLIESAESIDSKTIETRLRRIGSLLATHAKPTGADE